MQFSEMNLIPEILRAVEEVGYTEATDIQVRAIPVLLEGKDLIGRSNTGTGKTATLTFCTYLANFRISVPVCMASSRVGLRTRTCPFS